MQPSRGASGREWGQPDRIAESRDDRDILAERDAAGKQAAALLALFAFAADLQRADVSLLAVAFVTANLHVPAGEDAIFVGVAAFEPTAAARLLKMRKGGTVAACGVLEQTTWTTQAGETRSGWRLTAGEVLTAYGATKKRGCDE